MSSRDQKDNLANLADIRVLPTILLFFVTSFVLVLYVPIYVTIACSLVMLVVAYVLIERILKVDMLDMRVILIFPHVFGLMATLTLFAYIGQVMILFFVAFFAVYVLLMFEISKKPYWTVSIFLNSISIVAIFLLGFLLFQYGIEPDWMRLFRLESSWFR